MLGVSPKHPEEEGISEGQVQRLYTVRWKPFILFGQRIAFHAVEHCYLIMHSLPMWLAYLFVKICKFRVQSYMCALCMFLLFNSDDW